MSHTVRVGDKFRLLGEEWTVITLADDWFQSEISKKTSDLLSWPLSKADAIDWIKPVPKCSKEFAEVLKARIGNPEAIEIPVVAKSFQELFDWIDAHTE